MSIGISVIICCYNSAERIPDTIKHIALQKVPNDICWEVIIVDNASTDTTKATAEKEWEKHNTAQINFKVVSESVPGLMNARNKGILEAQYEYLLFCDDDNWLDDNYVSNAFSILNSNDSIGVLAGRSQVVSNFPIPFWFSTYQVSYAVGVLAINSGDVSERRHVWGAGMVFRKSVYQKLIAAGFKHYLVGRSGTKLLSGEDTEICAWHLLIGLKLWYSEDLFFYHYMSEERLSKDYLTRMTIGHQNSSIIAHQYYYIIESFKNKFFFFKTNKYKNILKYYYFKTVRKEEIPFDLLAAMQMHFPKKTYDEFTKNVLLSRKKYLDNKSF